MKLWCVRRLLGISKKEVNFKGWYSSVDKSLSMQSQSVREKKFNKSCL